jgi:putative PIN family toxin of toxin-antitoxin system
VRQIVLDTNVLVAGLRSKRGASHALIRILGTANWRNNVSVALALEYEDVLAREGLIPGLSTADLDDFLDYVFSVSNLIPTVPRVRPSLHDPDDERILEVAVACRGTIVTHNCRDFLGAMRFGVPVLSPKEFLIELEGYHEH